MSLRRLVWPWLLFFLAAGAGGALMVAPWLYGRSKIAALARPPDPRYASDNAQWLSKREPIDLVIIGDSRVAQWTPRPDSLRTVLLRGVGGETTVQTRQRLRTDALALQPRAVLILVGVNDLVAASHMSPRQRAVTRDAAADRLRDMAAEIAATGRCAIIATVPPPARPDLMRRWLWGEAVEQDVRKLNERLRTMAGPYVAILDLARLLPVKPDGYLDPSHAADTLHLNVRAYGAINDALRTEMASMGSVGRCGA